MPNWVEWHGSKLVELPILSLPSLFTLLVNECCEAVLNHMHNLGCLKRLELCDVFGLTCLSKPFVHFLNTIEHIKVGNCKDLKILWASDDIAHNIVNLQELNVFTETFRYKCEALKFLPSNMSCLQRLPISWCSIDNCPDLNLTKIMGSAHSYSNMTELHIWDCDSLQSFPGGGLPTLNLRTLDISNCQHLKILPHQMELLLSLQCMYVEGCPLLIEPFPEGKTPPNLTFLTINYCGKFKSIGAWQLQKFTSFLSLEFRGEYSSSNNSEGLEMEYDNQYYLLPPSLKVLRLEGLSDVEALPKGFLNIPSLQGLRIRNCTKLRELPMKERLLDKLVFLVILECPILKQWFLKNKGDYWPIFAHIPDVLIDYRDIHDPESSLWI